MSASHTPEAHPGNQQEAQDAQRESEIRAYEALRTFAYQDTPTPDQLSKTKQWLDGLQTFDKEGNLLNDEGRLILDQRELGEVRNYFEPENWLLGKLETTALTDLVQKRSPQPRRKRDHDAAEILDSIIPEEVALPPVLRLQIEQALGPNETPEQKATRTTKLAALRAEALGLLELSEFVKESLSGQAVKSHVESFSAEASRIASTTYDAKFKERMDALRKTHPDLSKLDPAEMGSLTQEVLRLAEADAQAAKENYIHEQTQGTQTPEVTSRSDDAIAAWEHRDNGEYDGIVSEIALLKDNGLDDLVSIKQLDRILYVGPGGTRSPQAEALINIVGEIPSLPGSSEVRAQQSKLLRMRSLKHRNNVEDKAMGREVRQRNAKLEQALEKLNRHRDRLYQQREDMERDREMAAFGVLHERLLHTTEQQPHLTADRLGAYLASDEQAAQALELVMQKGRAVGQVLEDELHISRPRREKLVSDMVKAGILGPENANGTRLALIHSADPFLPREQPPEPQPTPEETPVSDSEVQATPEKEATPQTQRAPETKEPRRLTDLTDAEIKEVRLTIGERVKAHLSWILEQKRQKLNNPEAYLSLSEKQFYAKEVYEDTLEEQIVTRYGIDDRDNSYAPAIAEGVRALAYDLEKVRVKRASDVFRGIVRQAGEQLTKHALREATNKYLRSVPIEDRETFAVVFGQLVGEILDKKTSPKTRTTIEKPSRTTPVVTSETRAERAKRVKEQRGH